MAYLMLYYNFRVVLVYQVNLMENIQQISLDLNNNSIIIFVETAIC